MVSLSLLSHCVPSYIVYAIDLESFVLDVKKRKEILLGLCTVSILEVFQPPLLNRALMPIVGTEDRRTITRTEEHNRISGDERPGR